MDAIASEIDHLQARIGLLQELRASPHATPELFDALERTFGVAGIRWLFEHSPALGGCPVQWVLDGRTKTVIDLVEAIGYGVYV